MLLYAMLLKKAIPLSSKKKKSEITPYSIEINLMRRSLRVLAKDSTLKKGVSSNITEDLSVEFIVYYVISL